MRSFRCVLEGILFLGMSSVSYSQGCTLGINIPPGEFDLQTGTLPEAWPLNASVQYIEFFGITYGIGGTWYYTSLPAAFQSALEKAYLNWSAAYPLNNSNVTWDFGGISVPVGPPGHPAWHKWIVVNPADIAPYVAITRSSYANYSPIGQVPYIRLVASNTRWSSADTSPASTVAHEIGHTMAINDCENCLAGSAGTIMSYQPQNGWAAPSACDDVQVHLTAFQ